MTSEQSQSKGRPRNAGADADIVSEVNQLACAYLAAGHCAESEVQCDDRFHFWRSQRVRYDSGSGDNTMFGLHNARPHEIDVEPSALGNRSTTAAAAAKRPSSGSNAIPQAYEVIDAIADPMNDTGLQALDRGASGSTGYYDVNEIPLNGVCHPMAWFLELFPHDLVQPLRERLGLRDIRSGCAPCARRDLNLTVGEIVQTLIHNVMHLALEMPDSVFPKARWLKPSRSLAETGPNGDPWCVLCLHHFV